MLLAGAEYYFRIALKALFADVRPVEEAVLIGILVALALQSRGRTFALGRPSASC